MSCKPELSTVNSNAVAVAAGGTAPLGAVVRKRGKRGCNGACPIELNGNAIVISEPGYYQFGINATFTAPVAGNAAIALYQNGVPVPGYNAATTVATANEQVASLALVAPDVRVFCGSVPASFTVVATGVALNFSNLAVSAKEV